MTHQEIDLADLLHSEGRRMTPQRQMVLDAVCEAGGHARPEEVYELVQQKSPSVNRATIYRTLKLLCELGLITDTLSADGYLVYEMAGDHPHHHLVCRRCGSNMEFTDAEYIKLVESIKRETSFKIETTHITLSGLCPSCQ